MNFISYYIAAGTGNPHSVLLKDFRKQNNHWKSTRWWNISHKN